MITDDDEDDDYDNDDNLDDDDDNKNNLSTGPRYLNEGGCMMEELANPFAIEIGYTQNRIAKSFWNFGFPDIYWDNNVGKNTMGRTPEENRQFNFI